MVSITIKQKYGTTLKGSVDELNAETEHARIGLKWSLLGDHLDIEDHPLDGANLSNGEQICEEIQRHLVAGGVQVEWPYRDGPVFYNIGSNGFERGRSWAK